MARRFISGTAFSAAALALVASWAAAGYNVSATVNITDVNVGDNPDHYYVQSSHAGTLLNDEDDINWYMYSQIVVSGPSPGSSSRPKSGVTDGHEFKFDVLSVYKPDPDDGSYSVYANTNMSAWGGSEGTVQDADSDSDSFSVP